MATAANLKIRTLMRHARFAAAKACSRGRVTGWEEILICKVSNPAIQPGQQRGFKLDEHESREIAQSDPRSQKAAFRANAEH